MTKTLTEQWREGTLPEDCYYVKKWDYEICMFYFEGDYFLDNDVPLSNGYIKEVLAPVPSYDEYKQLVSKTEQLEKKLAIATNAFEKIKRIKVGKENNFSILIAHSYSKEALKEMEVVK